MVDSSDVLPDLRPPSRVRPGPLPLLPPQRAERLGEGSLHFLHDQLGDAGDRRVVEEERAGKGYAETRLEGVPELDGTQGVKASIQERGVRGDFQMSKIKTPHSG